MKLDRRLNGDKEYFRWGLRFCALIEWLIAIPETIFMNVSRRGSFDGGLLVIVIAIFLLGAALWWLSDRIS